MNYYPLSLQQQPSVSDSSSCTSISGGGGCRWADDASRRHCHVHSRSISWEEHTVINQQQYSLSLSLWLAQSPTRCYANDKDDAVQHLQLATASLSQSACVVHSSRLLVFRFHHYRPSPQLSSSPCPAPVGPLFPSFFPIPLPAAGSVSHRSMNGLTRSDRPTGRYNKTNS